MPAYPTLSTFVHFGNQLFLLPTHVTSYSTTPTAGAASASPASPPAAAAEAAAAAAVAAELGNGGAAAGTAGAAGGAAAAPQPASLLAAHRMFSYRARLLSICRTAQLAQQQGAQEGGGGAGWGPRWRRWRRGRAQQAEHSESLEIVLAQLAPAVEVQQATASIPPLPPPLLAPHAGAEPLAGTSGAAGTAGAAETANAQAGSNLGATAAGNGSGALSAGALGMESSFGRRRWQWRPRLRLGRGQPGGSPAPVAAAAQQQPEAAAAPARSQGELVPVRVLVEGAGLDTCTTAWLRLPSGALLEAARLQNTAQQLLLEELWAEQGTEALAEGSLGRSLGNLLAWVPSFLQKGHSQQVVGGSSRQGGPGVSACLALEFAAPLAALLALQGPGASDVSSSQQAQRSGEAARPPLSLLLSTDFGVASAPLCLSAQAVWLLGPEPALCRSLFQQLSQAGELAAAAAARLPPPQPRHWLAAPLAGAASLTTGVGRGARAATQAVRALAARPRPSGQQAAVTAPAAVARPVVAADSKSEAKEGAAAEQEVSSNNAEPAAAGQRGGAASLWPQQLRTWLLPQRSARAAPQQSLTLGLTLVEASSLTVGAAGNGSGEGRPLPSLAARRAAAARCLHLVAEVVRRKGLQRLEQRLQGHSGLQPHLDNRAEVGLGCLLSRLFFA